MPARVGGCATLKGDNMPKGTNKGSCGGTPRRDGSGGGTGNKGTKRQPK